MKNEILENEILENEILELMKRIVDNSKNPNEADVLLARLSAVINLQYRNHFEAVIANARKEFNSLFSEDDEDDEQEAE